MRRDRPLAAVIFAVASAPGWLVLWLLHGGVGWAGMFSGAAASGVAGAMSGRALGAAARSDPRLWRAAVRGVLVGGAGAVLWTLGLVAVVVEDGPRPPLIDLAGAVVAVLLSLAALPWVLPGAVAGVAFYWAARCGAVPRRRRPIPRRARPVPRRTGRPAPRRRGS